MTAVTVTDRSALASALRDLKLSGMLATLDARLAQARAGELGHLDFLQVLCQDEVSRRESMSLARRIRRALRKVKPATARTNDRGTANHSARRANGHEKCKRPISLPTR